MASKNKIIISSFLGCKVALYTYTNKYCFSGKCTKGKWVDLDAFTFRAAQIEISRLKSKYIQDRVELKETSNLKNNKKRSLLSKIKCYFLKKEK